MVDKGNKRVPVNPNFLYSTRKRIEEFEKSILCKIFVRNSCDEDSVRLNGFRMFTLYQVLLACDDKMAHFFFDIVENPNYGLKSKIKKEVQYKLKVKK